MMKMKKAKLVNSEINSPNNEMDITYQPLFYPPASILCLIVVYIPTSCRRGINNHLRNYTPTRVLNIISIEE